MKSSETKRKVLITGAAGRVGRALVSELMDDYDLTLIDTDSHTSSHAQYISQKDAFDLDVLRSICKGVDTVIPLAISGDMLDDWDKVKPGNINGIGNVYKAAIEMSCRRVVFPSSVQILANPTSPYSQSKLWGEFLGKRFSARSDLSVICLRLGAVVSRNSSRIFPDSPDFDYILTNRDLVQLVKLAIEAPETLKYGVFWAISSNKFSIVDYSETEKFLGYVPQDDVYHLLRLTSKSPRVRMRVIKNRIKKWIRV